MSTLLVDSRCTLGVLFPRIRAWYGDYGHKRAGVWATHGTNQQMLNAMGQPVNTWAGDLQPGNHLTTGQPLAEGALHCFHKLP